MMRSNRSSRALGWGQCFTAFYLLRDDGTRGQIVDTRYNSDGSPFSQTTLTLGYDSLNRLTSEAFSGGSNAPTQYTNAYKYDLDGNRVELDTTGTDRIGVNSVQRTFRLM